LNKHARHRHGAAGHPAYYQIKNSLAATVDRRKICQAGMDVHHIVPHSVLKEFRDTFKSCLRVTRGGDVAAIALSQDRALSDLRWDDAWLKICRV
jgi:hypothetical protein